MSSIKARNIIKWSTISMILLVLIIFFKINCLACCEPGDSLDNPIIVDSTADLESIAQDVNEGNSYTGKYFILTKDIVIENNDNGKSLPTIWQSIGNINTTFDGTFNGNGHFIKCNINDFSNNSTNSLFGTIGKNGNIQNLNITGVINSNNSNSTSILCYTNYGNIENCTTNVNVTALGPLSSIAYENQGTIENCHIYGNLSNKSDFCSAGVIKNNGIIKKCSINATLKNSENTKNSNISGISIYNNNKIEDCIVLSNIKDILSHKYINHNKSASLGICCFNNGKVNNCDYHRKLLI